MLLQVNFFGGDKKIFAVKKSKGSPQLAASVSKRPLPTSLSSERGDTLSFMDSSRHLGSAVKQLAPTDLQSPLVSSKSKSGSDGSSPSVQLKRSFGVHSTESWLAGKKVIERITFAAVFGCVIFFTIKLSVMKSIKTKHASRLIVNQQTVEASSPAWTVDSSVRDNPSQSPVQRSSIANRLKELVSMVTKQFKNPPNARYSIGSRLPASLSTSITDVNKRPMPFDEAEALVKQWQAIKAEALGCSHQVQSLSEILDESMLVQVTDVV